jgi:hypothetical protein
VISSLVTPHSQIKKTGALRVSAKGARGLLFCAAKWCGAFPPNMPAGLRARVSRFGCFTRPFTG